MVYLFDELVFQSCFTDIHFKDKQHRAQDDTGKSFFDQSYV